VSEFCTSCGAKNSASSFCTSCGASLKPVSPPSTSPNTHQSATGSPASIPSYLDKAALPQDKQVSTKKKVVIGGLIFVLIAGISAGGFFTGKASIDLDKERSVAYDSGYEQGNVNGYSNGKESGYNEGFKEGKTAGCDAAYSFYDGSFSHIVPYDTVYRKMTGGYYNSRIGCD
jgi:hypothetical protein